MAKYDDLTHLHKMLLKYIVNSTTTWEEFVRDEFYVHFQDGLVEQSKWHPHRVGLNADFDELKKLEKNGWLKIVPEGVEGAQRLSPTPRARLAVLRQFKMNSPAEPTQNEGTVIGIIHVLSDRQWPFIPFYRTLDAFTYFTQEEVEAIIPTLKKKGFKRGTQDCYVCKNCFGYLQNKRRRYRKFSDPVARDPSSSPLMICR